MQVLINDIIKQLQDIQNGKLWVGSNYNKKLNQLTVNQVFERPQANLHSVAEIISHLTLWRSETILKIQTGKGSKTDDCEENWLPNHKLEIIGWDRIKKEYDDHLRVLIELLQSKEDHFLSEKYYDTDFKGYYDYDFVLKGMIHHDLYHLGQLGLIIKLLTPSSR